MGAGAMSLRPPQWSCARRGRRPVGFSNSWSICRGTSSAQGAVPPVDGYSSVWSDVEEPQQGC